MRVEGILLVLILLIVLVAVCVFRYLIGNHWRVKALSRGNGIVDVVLVKGAYESVHVKQLNSHSDTFDVELYQAEMEAKEKAYALNSLRKG